MITVKERVGLRSVSARALHRELGVTEDYLSWIERRLSEMHAVSGRNFVYAQAGRGNMVQLSPAFAQELALWERKPNSQAIAREIASQVSAMRTPIEPPKKTTVELVAPIAKAEAVIEGLNDPVVLRAVLFHYIELNDKRETAKRGK